MAWGQTEVCSRVAGLEAGSCHGHGSDVAVIIHFPEVGLTHCKSLRIRVHQAPFMTGFGEEASSYHNVISHASNGRIDQGFVGGRIEINAIFQLL